MNDTQNQNVFHVVTCSTISTPQEIQAQRDELHFKEVNSQYLYRQEMAKELASPAGFTSVAMVIGLVIYTSVRRAYRSDLEKARVEQIGRAEVARIQREETIAEQDAKTERCRIMYSAEEETIG